MSQNRTETPRTPEEGDAWEWHIQETFKGLIALSIEALKAMLLINGGAAVAILAYLGSLASRSPSVHLPNIKSALMWFAGGVLTAAVDFTFAYFTQLRLYQEERARHSGEPFRERHSLGITIATVLLLAAAAAFALGCWNASLAFQ
jgi:hypothetical protein